jgi:hypothetical protein
MNIVQELIKLADSLDRRGLRKEADMVDRIFLSAKYNVEFVSYSGKFPSLCYGDLVFKWNGKEWTINNLSSGGSLDENWHASSGDWKIKDRDWPEDFPEDPNLRKAVVQMVNDNVPPGCCGGCS